MTPTKRLGLRRYVKVFQGSLFTKQETRYIVLKEMRGAGVKRIKRVRNKREMGRCSMGNESGTSYSQSNFDNFT
jgi:hypothetical protein